jgi:hypothetical protein
VTNIVNHRVFVVKRLSPLVCAVVCHLPSL